MFPKGFSFYSVNLNKIASNNKIVNFEIDGYYKSDSSYSMIGIVVTDNQKFVISGTA